MCGGGSAAACSNEAARGAEGSCAAGEMTSIGAVLDALFRSVFNEDSTGATRIGVVVLADFLTLELELAEGTGMRCILTELCLFALLCGELPVVTCFDTPPPRVLLTCLATGTADECLFAFVSGDATGRPDTTYIGSGSLLPYGLARVEESSPTLVRFVATERTGTGVTSIDSGSPPPLEEMPCCLTRVGEYPFALVRFGATGRPVVTYFGSPLPLVIAYCIAAVEGRLSGLVPITCVGSLPTTSAIGTVHECIFALVCGDTVEVMGFGSLALVVPPPCFELSDACAPSASNAQLSRYRFFRT